MPRHRWARVLCPEVLRDHHKFHLPGEKRHPNFITFLNRKLQTNPDFCLNHKNGSTIPIFFSYLSCRYKSENLQCKGQIFYALVSIQRITSQLAKESRHIFLQWEPTVPCSSPFARASHQLHGIALPYDWLIWLPASIAIGCNLWSSNPDQSYLIESPIYLHILTLHQFIGRALFELNRKQHNMC